MESTFQVIDRLTLDRPSSFNDEHKKMLDEDGYTILPANTWIVENVHTLRESIDRLIIKESWRGGWEGCEQYMKPGKMTDPGSHRVSNLISKHPLFINLIDIPEIIQAAHHVIKDEIALGSLDLLEPLYKGYKQKLHIDCFPRKNSKEPFDQFFAFIYLDPSTKENGATRLVPKTHTLLDWPDEHLKDLYRDHPKQIFAEAKTGEIVVFNGHLWHGGTINESGDRRRSITLNFRNRRLPQLFNQKKYVTNECIKMLTDEQKYILKLRDNDPTDTLAGYAPGDEYRKRYGRSRHHAF